MDPHEQQVQTPVCAKRGWVLDVLTHDEVGFDATALPPGLKFHLGRCPGCRDVANKLMDASILIEAIAADEPDATLQDQADALAIAALRSGRPAVIAVELGDPVDEALIDVEAQRRRRMRLVWRGLAAAAIIAFAVLFGRAWQIGRQSHMPVVVDRAGAGMNQDSDAAQPAPPVSDDAAVPDEYQAVIDTLKPAPPKPAENGSVSSEEVPLEPDASAPPVGQAHKPKNR